MHLPREQLLRLCAVLAVCFFGTADAASLEEQRAAFRIAWPAAELGNWTPAEDRAEQLDDYVLWPDLRAAYLRARLGQGDDSDVRRFLATYKTLKPARELRYRFALKLGDEGGYQEFLDLYSKYYSEIGEPSLDCLAALAQIRLGHTVDDTVEQLWLVGRSQADQCDPVFAHMRSSGQLTPDLQRRRYALAIDAKQFGLARYVARSIGDPTLAEAERWLRANGNPSRFLTSASASLKAPAYATQLAHAAKRIGFSDPLKALGHWELLPAALSIDEELDGDVRRHIALWSARLHLPEAADLLDGLAPAAVDTEVQRWRIRTALRDQDWTRVIGTIDALPAEERERDEWRFWRALALEHTGARTEAMPILTSLAARRGYYGFLAADHLGASYALASDAVSADEAIIAELAKQPDLIRARELFKVGLDGRGRSEWDAAVRKLQQTEKLQAAILAHRWGWHSRAITVAASAGEMDDLDLRYPLPHRAAFQDSAAETGIAESWAYGVARSESLFMRDVRSSAGAIGLMQLIPSTGRRTARKIKHPYNGQVTLVDPDSNILLGTTYLAMMNERFDDHAALATAAYNAGPLRVEDWLPENTPMDARVWVESIPFNQTRQYVRRVLAAEVIFHWRLTGETQRLSARLPAVVPRTTSARLAAQ